MTDPGLKPIIVGQRTEFSAEQWRIVGEKRLVDQCLKALTGRANAAYSEGSMVGKPRLLAIHYYAFSGEEEDFASTELESIDGADVVRVQVEATVVVPR